MHDLRRSFLKATVGVLILVASVGCFQGSGSSDMPASTAIPEYSQGEATAVVQSWLSTRLSQDTRQLNNFFDYLRRCAISKLVFEERYLREGVWEVVSEDGEWVWTVFEGTNAVLEEAHGNIHGGDACFIQYCPEATRDSNGHLTCTRTSYVRE